MKIAERTFSENALSGPLTQTSLVEEVMEHADGYFTEHSRTFSPSVFQLFRSMKL